MGAAGELGEACRAFFIGHADGEMRESSRDSGSGTSAPEETSPPTRLTIARGCLGTHRQGPAWEAGLAPGALGGRPRGAARRRGRGRDGRGGHEGEVSCVCEGMRALAARVRRQQCRLCLGAGVVQSAGPTESARRVNKRESGGVGPAVPLPTSARAGPRLSLSALPFQGRGPFYTRSPPPPHSLHHAGGQARLGGAHRCAWVRAEEEERGKREPRRRF